MELALIAAKVLGVYLVVSGLFMLIRGKTLAHLLKDFFDHPAVLYLAGAVLIFVSVLYLLQSNVWDGTWRTVITLIAWATLVKGVSYVLFPEVLRKMITKRLLASLNLYGLIAIIAGLALFNVG